jgi:hypothetical protein
MKRAMASAALTALTALTAIACGGTTTPTTPSAPAPIPAAEACGALGSLSGMAGMTSIGIFNGAECSVTTTPVVKLNMRSSNGTGVGSCSGTLVTPRAVLTAAHCLDEDVATVRVWLGETGTLEYTAQSFVFYPGFVFNQSGFDVGVVLLGEDLPRTPAALLSSRSAKIGETAIIAGFGRTENSEIASLRAGSTTVAAIGRYIETLFAPPSSSICSGDSGGPIFVSEGGAWTVAGISSATTGSACNVGTNYYEAVINEAVRSFIIQHAPAVVQR